MFDSPLRIPHFFCFTSPTRSLYGSFCFLLRLFLPLQVTHLQDYLLPSSLFGSVTLQAPVTTTLPHPHAHSSSPHSPWHTQLSTTSLMEPFSVLTFTGMDTSCASSVLNPLTMSTPQICPSFSLLTRQTLPWSRCPCFFPHSGPFSPSWWCLSWEPQLELPGTVPFFSSNYFASKKGAAAVVYQGWR